MTSPRTYDIVVYGLGTIVKGLPGSSPDDALKRYINTFGADEAPRYIGPNEASVAVGRFAGSTMRAMDR